MRRLPILLLVSLLFAASSVATAQEPPIALGDDPRIAEAGIELAVFAEGLDFPMGLLELPDGSVLVAVNPPVRGSFFASETGLLRLTDRNGDGRADGRGTLLVEGLPGPVVALARAGDLVFATSVRGGGERIMIFRRGERWRDPLTQIGSIELKFAGHEHQSYGLAVRSSPDVANGIDVVFNLGAFGNIETGILVNLAGLTTGSVEDASIVMVTIVDDGETLTAGEPLLLARGLRNASGLVFDPETGDLIIGENGIDTPENRIVSFSADEINRIPAADIGGEVEDFGFPGTYVDYLSGRSVGTSGIAPLVAFSPVNGSENEGIAGIAPVPASFPAPLHGGYVAGFHGQFEGAGSGNEENPVVFADLETGDTFHLIANENPGVGHIDSFYAGDEVLWMADLCTNGTLTQQPPCGVIYRLTASDR
jgi:hypothetical protein